MLLSALPPYKRYYTQAMGAASSKGMTGLVVAINEARGQRVLEEEDEDDE